MAPASLLANWQSEAARFAPSLRTLVAHPSAMAGEEIRALDAGGLAGVDLVITSYGTPARTPSLLQVPWRLAIVDEAQAIKNPGARQTRAVKQAEADSGKLARLREIAEVIAAKERIDALIDAKRRLSHDLLDGGGDVLLTEMSDDELLKVVALDLRAASQD